MERILPHSQFLATRSNLSGSYTENAGAHLDTAPVGWNEPLPMNLPSRREPPLPGPLLHKHVEEREMELRSLSSWAQLTRFFAGWVLSPTSHWVGRGDHLAANASSPLRLRVNLTGESTASSLVIGAVMAGRAGSPLPAAGRPTIVVRRAGDLPALPFPLRHRRITCNRRVRAGARPGCHAEPKPGRPHHRVRG